MGSLVPALREHTGLHSRGANGRPILPSSSKLKEVLATAQLPANDLESLLKLRSNLQEQHSKTLQVETTLRARLTSELLELDKEIIASKVNHGRPSKLSYLDLSVLTWRHATTTKGVRVPKFALIDVSKNGIIRFVSSRTSRNAPHSAQTYNSNELEHHYSDVKLGLESKISRWTESATLSFEFEGAIPEHARELIVSAQDARFQGVYLLVDTPREAWRFNQVKTTREQRRQEFHEKYLDPLVLGLGGEKLWILGAFDATDIEEYVQREFAIRG